MNTSDIKDDSMFHIFEFIDYPVSFRYVAGFESIEDAKDYVDYLATQDRMAWIYGHMAPPLKCLEDFDSWYND